MNYSALTTEINKNALKGFLHRLLLAKLYWSQIFTVFRRNAITVNATYCIVLQKKRHLGIFKNNGTGTGTVYQTVVMWRFCAFSRGHVDRHQFVTPSVRLCLQHVGASFVSSSATAELTAPSYRQRNNSGPKKLWNFDARACIGLQKNLDFINKNVTLD